MNVPIRYDPDFKPTAQRTIDLRPFFKDEEENGVENGVEDGAEEKEIPYVPETVVSPAYREEERRRKYLLWEREERERNKPVMRIFLEGFRDITKAVLVFLIERFQDFEQYLNPFETKHTEKELYYLAISLPNTVKRAEDVLLCYPQMSRRQRYELLKIKKDRLAMHKRIFER